MDADAQVSVPVNTPAAPEFERRAATRCAPSDLPCAVACRITPGRDVSIVNISATGMLVESMSPLFPGRTVKLQLTHASPSTRSGTRSEKSRVALSGSVVRSCMAAIDRGRGGGATFLAAIAFERRFDAATELAPHIEDEETQHQG